MRAVTVLFPFLSFLSLVVSRGHGSTKPTVVLVPGAWHSPVHYSLVTNLLNQKGYQVVSQRLPSVNSSTPKLISVTTDADFIRNEMILPLLDQGKDILLIAHSYGGSPGAAAAYGLSKAERTAAGENGGIIGLIFIAAFLAETGLSVLAALGGQFSPFVVVNNVTGQLGFTDPQLIFYNGVPTPLADRAISLLLPESENALSTAPSPPAWSESAFDGRRAYIHTLLDNCVPPIAQEAMLNATDVTWQITDFDTGHSPFLVEPVQLTQTIVNYSCIFEGSYT